MSTALMADPRFRDSMRLIEHYSLSALHDPEAVILPQGGYAVLSLDDLPGSSWSTRASVLYRRSPRSTQSGRHFSSVRPADTVSQLRGLSSLGPPTSAGDGSHSGPRHNSWASALQEAAPVSDAADRSPVQDQPLSAVALRTV